MSSSSAAAAAPVYQFRPVCLESSAQPLNVIDSYMTHTHTHNIHTKEFGWHSGVGVFLPTCMPLMRQTHTDSWHVFVLLDSCSKCKSVAFLESSASFGCTREEKIVSASSQMKPLCFPAEEVTQRKRVIEGKKNFTERAASFTDQSVIRECSESTLSSLKFFWYINPEF